MRTDKKDAKVDKKKAIPLKEPPIFRMKRTVTALR